MDTDRFRLNLAKGDYIRIWTRRVRLAIRRSASESESYYLRVVHVQTDPADVDYDVTALLLDDLLLGKRAGQLVGLKVRTKHEGYLDGLLVNLIKVVEEKAVNAHLDARDEHEGRLLAEMLARREERARKRAEWTSKLKDFYPNLTHFGRE